MKYTTLTLVLHCPIWLAAQSNSQLPTDLPSLLVTGKAEDLLGNAESASQGSASAADLLNQAYLRRSEILEIVPGLITTQHAGGGKATQYFLRGFNLDHGTEFAVSLDAMPINMRTHTHGQGYADLNFIIPEFVDRIDYTKGVYAAKNGDLSSAGSADFQIVNSLEHSFVSSTIGERGFYRTVAGHSMNAGIGTLTLGGEWNTYDGPWERPEDFQRWNGLTRWFTGNDETFTSITAMLGATDWNSSDQIPLRAVTNGSLSRFGTIDPTTGGDSQRHSLQFLHQSTSPDTVTRVSGYGVYYDLDLYSNFTYFTNPADGDQFQQIESRYILGGEITRTWLNRQLFGKATNFTAGFQTRNDFIDDIALNKTKARQFLSSTRQDDVAEGSYSLFGDSTIRWTDQFRSVVGLRADLFHFDVNSNLAANSGDDWDGMISPKLGLIFAPQKHTEYYFNLGTGFHSNDARGVTTTIDPDALTPVDRVDPLVRTIGGEIGVRTNAIKDLTSTLTLWWLDSDSELVYVGDAGTNEAGPASRRFGIEWANYYRPNDWFTADCEISLSHARLLDVGTDDYVPNSVPAMVTCGIAIGKEEGWFGSMRVRAFDRRPLDETGDIEGRTTLSVNGRVGYRTHDWEIAMDVLNILDRRDNDIEYYYESQLATELASTNDIHFHPAEPRMVRLSATYRF